MEDRNFAEKKLIEELSAACEGLTWMSESDYPWQIVSWQGETKINSEILKGYYKYAPEIKVLTKTLSSFFESVIVEQKWHDEIEKLETLRYQNLYRWFNNNLKDIQVFLVGEIEVDVYILGKSKDNSIIGLSTKVIET
ncbi:MAG: nuclease A inhibitor family protein [Pleurocapsa sp.]